MDALDRWVTKADALVSGYLRTMGSAPSKHAVILALCVAEFETRCGDAASGNWGGTTAAQLTPEERGRLRAADLSPSNPSDLVPARALLGEKSGKILGQDSDPRAGWYWIWFYHPSTPADGAAYFVRVLVHQRPTCQAILEDDDGTLEQLARAMYATHYYSGRFDPHARSVTYDNRQMSGDEADIESYRDNLIRIMPGIVTSLANWAPNDTAYDLLTTLGMQEALTYLASKLGNAALDPKGVDGDFGPDTKAAVEALQSYAGINVDGDVGTDTRSAILRLVETSAPVTT